MSKERKGIDIETRKEGSGGWLRCLTTTRREIRGEGCGNMGNLTKDIETEGKVQEKEDKIIISEEGGGGGCPCHPYPLNLTVAQNIFHHWDILVSHDYPPHPPLMVYSILDQIQSGYPIFIPYPCLIHLPLSAPVS